jgi:sn-glycerol 3-phosphate transport system permease protein
MIERTPILNAITHVIMLLGVVVAVLPIAIVFIASTHDFRTVNMVPMPLWPGDQFFENYARVWEKADFGAKMINSLIVAVGVTVGKIVIAALSAFAIVYFKYKLRMVFFWLIFITLMLPLEVRIVPTYAVVADTLSPFRTILDFFGLPLFVPEVNLLNTYTGLILPLVATATGTFLYRQFFLTIPDELAEAAKMDGAGPIRFFLEVLIPLSKTNMAALATIMFVYAWNQYLWPLLVVTNQDMATATMAATLLVMIPPLLVVIFMQGYFVRGLVNTDK